jgi:release factor glutamine methyltransferase
MATNVASVGLTVWNSDVYEPSDDSFTLVDALEMCAAQWKDRPPRTCVEIGCGSGYVICSLALMLKQLHISSALLATDISKEALKATQQTLHNHGVDHVELVHTDLLSGVIHKLQHSIDILVRCFLITSSRRLVPHGLTLSQAAK